MKHLIQEKWHHCPLSVPKVSLQSRWSDRGPFPWLSTAVIMKPNLLSLSHLTCLAGAKLFPGAPRLTLAFFPACVSCVCTSSAWNALSPEFLWSSPAHHSSLRSNVSSSEKLTLIRMAWRMAWRKQPHTSCSISHYPVSFFHGTCSSWQFSFYS